MKVGIMTCWQPDDNYGTQIQCFALQHYLRNAGHEAFLIRYVRANDTTRSVPLKTVLKALNPYLVARKFHSLLRHRKMIEETAMHDRDAPQFRERYLCMSRTYNSHAELLLNPPEADAYIVGSDQVWNNVPHQTGQFDSFFLNFGGDSVMRIAYAASFGFGPDRIPKGYGSRARPLLDRFDGISVREQSGISILSGLGVRNAVVVADPTLLLDAAYYRKIYGENDVPAQRRKYVLAYNLSSKSNLDAEKIREWADEKGLDFVYITGHGQADRLEKCYARIPQWLYLIDNAEYVFTNSFHGAIFSLLFHKKFVVFKLCGNHEITNSRLDTIENLISSERIVASMDEALSVMDAPIDWDLFERRKDSLAAAGKEFLDEHLYTGGRKERNE